MWHPSLWPPGRCFLSILPAWNFVLCPCSATSVSQWPFSLVEWQLHKCSSGRLFLNNCFSKVPGLDLARTTEQLFDRTALSLTDHRSFILSSASFSPGIKIHLPFTCEDGSNLRERLRVRFYDTLRCSCMLAQLFATLGRSGYIAPFTCQNCSTLMYITSSDDRLLFQNLFRKYWYCQLCSSRGCTHRILSCCRVCSLWFAAPAELCLVILRG